MIYIMFGIAVAYGVVLCYALLSMHQARQETLMLRRRSASLERRRRLLGDSLAYLTQCLMPNQVYVSGDPKRKAGPRTREYMHIIGKKALALEEEIATKKT